MSPNPHLLDITPEESKEINEWIDSFVSEVGFDAMGGKQIAYWGWYWRDVDFTKPFQLGRHGDLVGFIENNKWGYDEWTTDRVAYLTITSMLRTMHITGGQPSLILLKDLNDYMKSLVGQFAK